MHLLVLAAIQFRIIFGILWIFWLIWTKLQFSIFLTPMVRSNGEHVQIGTLDSMFSKKKYKHFFQCIQVICSVTHRYLRRNKIIIISVHHVEIISLQTSMKWDEVLVQNAWIWPGAMQHLGFVNKISRASSLTGSARATHHKSLFIPLAWKWCLGVRDRRFQREVLTVKFEARCLCRKATSHHQH